jgi:hypothetical protein
VGYQPPRHLVGNFDTFLIKKKEAKIEPQVLYLDIWDIAAFRGCFHFYNSVKKL